jgi:multiphosphoryl transfer protein
VIGLVVVSHSRALARAAVGLAREMTHATPARIEIAAGLDDTTFGTDATQIVTAITAANSGDGVVVLMDLGSAVLSAELALDLLDDATREEVLLCPAPLVEGLVVAAVAAAGGAGRAEVAAEAAAALAGKQSHLGPVDEAPAGGSVAAEAAGQFTIATPHGLHARPAARLVAKARAFDARVEIRNRSTGSAWVPASSLSRVATLGALRGHDLEVRASGPQAADAVDHLLALADRDFDESDLAGRSPAAARGSADPNGYGGVPAAPGIGVGTAWIRRDADVPVPDLPSEGAAVEWRRLREAIAAVRRDIQRIRIHTTRAVGVENAAIFDAHLLLLDDVDLLNDVRARIEAGEAAAPAWAAGVARIAADFATLADGYLQARAADVRAVGDQVLRALLGVAESLPDGGGVLVADDLTPAEAAGLDPDRVNGVLLAYGSATSHAAILARARGIPVVAGLGPRLAGIAAGTRIVLDGSTGQVVVNPASDVLAIWENRAADAARRRAGARARAHEPASTTDGVEIAVGANLGSVADAEQAAANGADLAGLVRTEFLFLDRSAPPDVDEQVAVYRDLADALGGRRLTLRTLDVGGDKPLRYAPAPAEANPFLGIRGLRHSFAHPELLAEQLLAIVRIAHQTPVSVMFPMVSGVDEVRRARRALDDAIRLHGAGEPIGLRVGIMVEVPAIALKAAAVAPYVDFLSIGTNDLTQYALAAERGNPALDALADGLDPGVLRLIDAVCRGAAGRAPVGLCGELAADEPAVAVLTGLGIRQLSVAAGSVPAIKEAVREIDLAKAAAVAAAALDAPSAAAVRALLAA